MDDGRVLTISQKRRILSVILLLAAVLLADLALWQFLGRPQPLLGIAGLLAGALVLTGAGVGIFVLFRRCTPNLTYRVRRRIHGLLLVLLVLAAVPAARWLLREIGSWDWATLKPDITITLPTGEMSWEIPGLQIVWPEIRIGFWHVVFLAVGVLCCLGAFGNGLGRGLVSIPVLGMYELLLLAACSGGLVGDNTVFWKIMGATLTVLLVSGLLLWDFSGFVLLLGLLRFLVPVSLVALIAIRLQTASPVTAPPVNFRAVYHWILLITVFLVQNYQLCSPSFPETEYVDDSDDDPIPHMLGNEYEEGTLDP